MVQVNPSPQPKLPKAIRDDPQALAYFNQLEVIIRQLRERTGGDSDKVDQAFTNYNINLSSQVAELRQQALGLPEFTMDTEGFTMDSTMFTMDKVIA